VHAVAARAAADRGAGREIEAGGGRDRGVGDGVAAAQAAARPLEHAAVTGGPLVAAHLADQAVRLGGAALDDGAPADPVAGPKFMLIGIVRAEGDGAVGAGAAAIGALRALLVGADAGVDEHALAAEAELKGERVGVDVADLMVEADAARVPQDGPGAPLAAEEAGRGGVGVAGEGAARRSGGAGRWG
jgi:hypothetical protein